MIDGVTDYPIAFGRQTYQDSLFRTWAAGNITADPTNAAHLAVVWSDMRNSTTPAPSDPYAAKTNSDVDRQPVVRPRRARGRRRSALALAGDQFMPWGAYDTRAVCGSVRSTAPVDPANHKYDYSLATETAPGALTFTTAQVTTVNSDPTTGDRWFAGNVNAAFPFATSFLGDYSNIAATAGGGVVAYWTDMRNDVTFGTRTGHGEDAYFAKMP